MALFRSRISPEGRVSIPAEIRRKLGVGPGSILEWHEDGDKIVVRCSGQYTFKDIHKTLFPEGPPKAKTLAELKEGIRQYIREKHGRR